MITLFLCIYLCGILTGIIMFILAILGYVNFNNTIILGDIWDIEAVNQNR